MDFNSAIDILIKDLEEARAIIDDLKKIPGVPAFQVELAKSKCRSASEMIELLRNVDLSYKPVEECPEHEKKKNDNTSDEDNQVSESENDDQVEETIADRFSLERELNFPAPSIHSSLSEAIGINDRFHFIREIFGNNPGLYSEVIGKLDSISDIGEARSLIMGYAFDESSRSAGNQLLDLVRRKLQSDE